MDSHTTIPFTATFIRIASIAAIAQLLVLSVGIVVTAGVGVIPTTAIGFFTLMHDNLLMGFLIDDFFSVLLITLYLFTFPALFQVLKTRNFSLSFYGAILSVIAVILTLSAHTGFSLLHLNGQYWAATDEMTRTRFLTAGEAVIAGNIWNSTAGFFSGVFLQGGGILMSAAMVGSGRFRRLTIIAGLLANSLDLINHLIGHWLPVMARILLFVGGPFYLVWYIMLFLDLRRLRKENIYISTSG